MSRTYDIIIFGASGCTGKYVVEIALYTLKTNQSIKWAIAGRNMLNSKATLEYLAERSGVDASCINVLEADVTDFNSLKKLAADCRVLINAVGPYSLFGESVVNACVEESTNYVDFSVELPFLEKCYQVHNESAQNKGIYIIGACGTMSMIADIGTVYLQQNFKGEIRTVDVYLKTNLSKKSAINVSSWNSIVHMLEHMNISKIYCRILQFDIRRSCSIQRLIRHREMPEGWWLPILQIDEEVVERSQTFLAADNKKSPVQFRAYYYCPDLTSCILFIFGCIALWAFTRINIGVEFIKKFPRLFSFGAINIGHPSREEAENQLASYYFVAQCGREYNKVGNKGCTDALELQIDVKNALYKSTAIIALESALTILNEPELLPNAGGVLLPGSAFSNSTIINRLQIHGITFNLRTH